MRAVDNDMSVVHAGIAALHLEAAIASLETHHERSPPLVANGLA